MLQRWEVYQEGLFINIFSYTVLKYRHIKLYANW